MIGWAQMILTNKARIIGSIMELAAIIPAIMIIIDATIRTVEVLECFIVGI